MNRAAFLDRDGVINLDHGYTYQWEQFEFLPGVPEALRQLQDAGFQLIVVSNQSGIGRGFYSDGDLATLNAHIAQYLTTEFGVAITGFYHCPHHPTDAQGEFLQVCDCRKPAPGMIVTAARDHHIDITASLLVGDKSSDIEAGRAAGVGRLFRVLSLDEVAPGDEDVTCVSALRDVPGQL
jgi:D-glycero-D-manno-heptose 1,7-bisphosphate phosphatase